jgi:hypothetical protein
MASGAVEWAIVQVMGSCFVPNLIPFDDI